MQQIKKEDRNDFAELFNAIVNNWPWYIVSVSVLLLLAFLINTYSPRKYRVTAKMLIPQSRGFVNASEVLPGFEQLMGINNFQNELEQLRSFPIIKSTIKKLNFEVSYYKKDKLFKRELFKKSPFLVVFDRQYLQPVDIYFKINIIDKNSFQISAEKESTIIYSYIEEKEIYRKSEFSINKTLQFGEEIESDHYKFKVLLLTGQEIKDINQADYFFIFNDLDNMAMQLRTILDIRTAARNSTVASINFELNNATKAITFIRGWCDEFINLSVEKKNEVAKTTLNYINNQLSQVSDSLRLSSLALQEYRTQNNIIDITTQIGAAYSQLQALEAQEAELDVQNKYYKYIDDYFKQNKDISDLVSPSSMGIDDQSLNTIVHEYVILNNQRKILLDKSQQNNPQLKDINFNIENLKITISENIKYSRRTSEVGLDQVRRRLYNLRNEVNQLPITERQLVGIERKFRLNEATYNFLLQKQVDAQIAQSSNVPTSQIIEPARLVSKGPVSPNKKLNYIVAFILGIFLPFGIMIIKELFNTKIRDINDIRRFTDLPVLGKMGSISSKKEFNVFNNPKSELIEMFRILRTNLIYFVKSKKPQLLTISSSISNEGKSFISLNLASSFAAFKKKTVLINCDIRNPELDQFFKFKKDIGLSTYLAGSSSLEDILIDTEFDNLTFIPAGPLPPDPLELIASQNTSELFNTLRKKFEYILIDTAPAGFFSDSLILSKYSDLNLLVVRVNHTQKKEFEQVIKNIEQNEIAPIEIILNDCQDHKSDFEKYYRNYQTQTKRSKKK